MIRRLNNKNIHLFWVFLVYLSINFYHLNLISQLKISTCHWYKNKPFAYWLFFVKCSSTHHADETKEISCLKYAKIYLNCGQKIIYTFAKGPTIDYSKSIHHFQTTLYFHQRFFQGKNMKITLFGPTCIVKMQFNFFLQKWDNSWSQKFWCNKRKRRVIFSI